MGQIAKFLRLPQTERRLVLGALSLVSVIRLALSLFAFRTVLRVLARVTREQADLRNRPRATPERVAWAVAVASRYVPKATCLTQALAGRVLLARHGHSAELRIGVARSDGAKLDAHAWLESRGQVLLGGAVNNNFTALPSLEKERQ
jgi:hypothetical protein